MKWPIQDLQGPLPCPACHGWDRTLLYAGLTDMVFASTEDEWSLWRCAGCGSAYLDPRPTEDSIHLAYRTYYTHTPKSGEQARYRSLKWLSDRVANDYWNRTYGGSRQPALPLGQWLVTVARPYKRVLDRRARYMPRPPLGARLLDIGFGGGEFMEFAIASGWMAKGIDPDPVTVENAKARGLDVRCGTMAFLGKDRPESFDAITMSHVIEHVHEPGPFLKQVADALKPGGRIYVETPNLGALGHARFGRFWRGLETPRHLTLFTWQSLENLLRECGFHRIRRISLPAVYPPMAAKSRALSQGEDPYRARTLLRDRFAGLCAGLRTRLDHRRSEFIALTARKA